MESTQEREFSVANRFCLYGDGMHSMTLEGLMDLQTMTAGDLLARPEHSGSEGCYCEVARWNEMTGRWERFAFHKYLTDPENDAQEAANLINNAAWHYGDARLVHVMPDWVEYEASAT